MSIPDLPLIAYPSGYRIARLIKREKRFMVLVELDGKEVWAHTNNTGSMMGLLRAGLPVLLSPAQNPKRKLLWTVEAIGSGTDSGSLWIGVNTSVPNRFIEAAFRAGIFPWLKEYSTIKREAVHEESRLDALFTSNNCPPLWVECKNVSMVEYDQAAFPDAVSERGSKHLGTLARLAQEGNRAAMLYVVQRNDAQCFGPADFIDPVYADNLRKVSKMGVEIYAVRTKITESGIYHDGMLDIKLGKE